MVNLPPKPSLFMLFILCAMTSALKDSEACANCFFNYSGDAYYHCLNQYCHSTFISQSSLFASTSKYSSTCLSCSGLSTDYSSCVKLNCKSEILSKALEVSSLHPNTLLTYMPTEEKLSFVCKMGEEGCICTEVYWEQEINLGILAENDSRCKQCTKYSGEYYRNCATFHCSQEIETQLSSGNPGLKPVDLSECTDKCYEEYLQTNSDYSTCVRIKCNKKRIGLTQKSNASKQCNSCMNLADSYYMSKCIQTYCKSEIITELLQDKQNLNFGCVDCSSYYEAGNLEDYQECLDNHCKGDLAHAGYEYFSQGTKFSSCGQCTSFEPESEHEQACVLIYCVNEILGKTLYLESGAQVFTEFECLNKCMNSKGMSEVCYQTECKESIMKLFRLYAEDFKRQEMFTGLQCSSCLKSGNLEECVMLNCKSQVLGKENLFVTDGLVKFGKQCNVCLNFEGFQYFSCVSNNCKQEVSDRVLLIAAKSPEKLMKQRSVYFNTCEQCAQYYSPPEVEFQYICIVQNCKSEFVNKPSLLLSKPSGFCSECSQFSDDEFHNCAVFFCKAEIESEFEQFKLENSLSMLESIVKLNECTDSCYYDWFFYGYDYNTCAYEYCRTIEDSKAPISLKNKFSLKDYKSQCAGNTQPYCIINMCQSQDLNELTSNTKNSKCSDCALALFNNQITEKGFKACVVLSCLSDLSAILEKSDHTISLSQTSNPVPTQSEQNLEEYCTQLLNGEIQGEYKNCYHLFNSLESSKHRNSSLNFYLITLILSSILVGLLSRYKKSSNVSLAYDPETHPYQLL